MENVSAVTSFILTAYTELEDHRYLYFICFLVLYIMIIVANSVLITVIYIERGLHEPMYLFICSLAVNGVFGSTSLLPSMLVFLLSYNYEISLTHCLLQIYCLYSYAFVEFTILAAMSYDRYVAICHPLHYHLLMSPKKLYAAITLSWAIPLIYFVLFFIMTFQLTFCGKIIEKVYCANFPLVKLSCVDTNVQYIVGLALTFISPLSQILMILFSYGQIIRICLFASKESQAKAIRTCTPHLLTVINFSVGVFFEAIQSRFNMSHVPYKARIFLSLHMGIFPPLLNPVIYGISNQAIKNQIFKLFNSKKDSEPHSR
ncbi:olfactory receptor 10J5-like [Anguilla rostrata]|uniref:olfactory receptor 10J5-like n=1 Tax=Anguilla rostrata TaxID=7938 RepID=UPI0030D01FDD